MTSEQQVIEIQDKAKELYDQYKEYLLGLVGEDESVLSKKDLLHVNKLGVGYFNFIESSIGQTSLLGAHINDRWVLDFAETCYNALEVLCEHTEFVREKSSELDIPAMGQYSTHAFANMQRMVMEYLPETKEALKQKFIALDIPIEGFNNMQNFNGRSKIASWQWGIAAIGWIIGAVLGYLIIFQVPDPNELQIKYFKAVLSIATAMQSVLIPGTLSIEGKVKQMGVTAVGALAIFVLTWFFSGG